MGDNLKQKLAKSIELADEVNNTPDVPIPFKQYCGELKSKAKKLSDLLRLAAPTSSELYMQRPMWLILEQTEHILNETLSLILKCRPNNIKKRIFTIISIDAFRKTSSQLENSINDVSWLLHISRSDENHDSENLILPSIAFNEPILASIWELIASLCTGSQEDRSDAAACLVSLAHQSDRYSKMIIQEGGVGPLLKLTREGNAEGQKNAARAIGLLKVINSIVILITSASMLCEHGS
ncbi:hypothetical protein MtrunA17_Chr7g0228791 [Medicago truncatula]|uniref:Armadillo repeat only protein n=1 Tax=Medicago truncatula TaxID=3880 RepID=A0A072THA8_MEDTR|nr:armadillo repeat only protein [Medicago truncatula]RHN45286.1 hypothetical protein MtrunA17_Chr7g0228791 [Medicago truncatula]